MRTINEKCYLCPLDDLDDGDIKTIFKNNSTIAIVGASPNPMRASNDNMKYLLENGYEVFPVNPNHDKVCGMECYATLKDVPSKIEIVDIFRNPNYVMPIVKDAISINANVVWMQLGVVNDFAYKLSMEAGMTTIMNRCIKVEHQRLML